LNLRFFSALTVCLVGGLTAVSGAADTSLAEITVVVYNQAEPISLALAKLYAQQRGIAADHLVGVDCSIDEDVSRDDFEATIAQPLRQTFKERKWWTLHVDSDGKESVTATSIRFLALIRGIGPACG
jgi:uncharacterized protein (TIGR03790 family)